MAEDLFPSTHPLTPPLTEEVWLSWLRLLRSRRVGISTFYRLMEEFGSAYAALDALPGIASAAGVTEYTVAGRDVAEREWEAARLAGARPLAFGGEDYPRSLMALTDAPPFLWCIGDASILSRPTVVIVGARNASSLGTRMARRLGTDLSKSGFVIASGLARGVDTAAHLAALETGTVAVLGGGVDVVYPAENAVLAQEIGEKGALLSEQPMGLAPQARHFPARNRIVSGLSKAVVVAEAAARSGSLITARTALDQGREVFAVPGHPFDARASGCNMLIRDGATLIRGADDVIAALGEDPVDVERSTERPVLTDARKVSETLTRASDSGNKNAAEATNIHEPTAGERTVALHEAILSRLGPSPTPEDELIRDLKGLARDISPEIAALEIEGRIRRDAGGMLLLAD